MGICGSRSESFDKVLNVNLKGTLLGCNHALRKCLSQAPEGQ